MKIPAFDPQLRSLTHTLLATLREIKSVQLTGAAMPPEDEWKLEGLARTEVSEIPGGLLVQESGQLHRNNLPISYQTSWSFETDDQGQLWLGHARQGAPLRLLILTPTTKNHWISEQPHLCGDDLYEAQLTIQPGYALQLCWKTSGPKKMHEITRNFSPLALSE